MNLVGPIDGIIDDTIYTVLTLLIPAIDNIDGECSVCIRKFIKDVNQELERLEIRYRYEFSRDKQTRKEKVEVIKV